LELKKNFSSPKIYSANGDLSKRWYVYFSYRDPSTGKLKRQTPIYANANKFKTKEDRLSILVTYRKSLLKLLKKGYSPYADNTELLSSKKQEKAPIKPQIVEPEVVKKESMCYKEAFTYGLKQ